LQQIAAKNPQTTLVWCHVDHASNLNFDIKKLFHHNKLMLSFNPSNVFLSDRIGYVDESFVN
jgi:small-conductance mechanosensitive channel